MIASAVIAVWGSLRGSGGYGRLRWPYPLLFFAPPSCPTDMANASETADVVVIGGGPGGYVAAIRAAQLGLNTVCVEMDKTLGGTCVNVGCIPSKALLQSSEHFEFARLHARRARHQLRRRHARPRDDDEAQGRRRRAEHAGRRVPVQEEQDHVGEGARHAARRATSSRSRAPTARRRRIRRRTSSSPPARCRSSCRSSSSTRSACSRTSARSRFREVPKHLIVIGGGVIGLELGSVWRRLGAKVTVVELMPTILPGMDDDIVKEADKIFRKQGLEIRAGTKVTGATRRGRHACSSRSRRTARQETLEADYVLVSVGRRPSLTGIDAAALGLNVGKRGEIVVDDADAHEPAERLRHRRRASAASCSRTRPRRKASSPPR